MDDSNKWKKLINKINIVLNPLKPANSSTNIPDNIFLNSKRTDGGNSLPKYYLVYFLFIDLLKYKDLGQWEKVSYRIPVDYNGKYFTIEYRKFGLGIFGENQQDIDANKICNKINKAVKIAEPFFESIARGKVDSYELNVINNSHDLYSRYQYHLKLYERKANSVSRKPYNFVEHEREGWLALSAIDSFFSWTEQIFIHIGILQGKLKTGTDVVNFADKEWKSKYKEIIGITDNVSKKYYDKLTEIKSQLRNYYSHGAFGKTGEAFEFHSTTGAVPLNIVSTIRSRKTYKLHGKIGFSESDAINEIKFFINSVLWAGPRKTAELYIMNTSLPSILTYSCDGTYKKAMESIDNMRDFTKYLTYSFDNAANMDW